LLVSASKLLEAMTFFLVFFFFRPIFLSLFRITFRIVSLFLILFWSVKAGFLLSHSLYSFLSVMVLLLPTCFAHHISPSFFRIPPLGHNWFFFLVCCNGGRLFQLGSLARAFWFWSFPVGHVFFYYRVVVIVIFILSFFPLSDLLVGSSSVSRLLIAALDHLSSVFHLSDKVALRFFSYPTCMSPFPLKQVVRDDLLV